MINEHGLHSDVAAFFCRGRLVTRADFTALRSRSKPNFPYVNVLTQDLTEAFLAERAKELDVHILRGYKADSLIEDEKGLITHFENGATVAAKYVIGADGAKSAVSSFNIFHQSM